MRLAFTGPPGANKRKHAKVVAGADPEREMQRYFERGERVPDQGILHFLGHPESPEFYVASKEVG